MQIVVVNAYGRSNRGDSVLLDECLVEICKIYPNAKISASVFEGIDDSSKVHPRVNWYERIGNSTGNRFFAKLKTLWFLIVGLIAAVMPSSRIENLLPILQKKTFLAIRESNIVISAPGGYIHDTNFAYYVALFHIHLGTLLGKTVVVAPQSIGPLDGKIARIVAKYVLSKVQYICPRESYSYKFLVSELKLKPSQIYKTGDSAFWNDVVEDNDREIISELKRIGLRDGEKIFGMTVVGWSFPKSENSKNAYENYVNLMAKVAEHISINFNMKPVIFNQVSEDLPTALLVQKRANCSILVDEKSHEPWMLRALIRRSTVFIGTRFHSCIFAMMAGRPTLAVAYLPKTEFIMNDLCLSKRHISIDNFDYQKAIAQISNDIENLDVAEKEIRDAVTVYRSNFSRLRDILSLIKT